MTGKKIRKFLISGIIILAIFISADCKKQTKCGCGKDVYQTLVTTSVNIYFSADKAIITCSPVGNPYFTYNFCNPSEMAQSLGDAKYGDVMLVSGSVYLDCQAIYQSSNSVYRSVQQVYEIVVSELTLDLYGKNPTGTIN